MKRKHLERLRRALDEGGLVRVERRLVGGDPTYAYVLGLSDTLLLLYAVHDLHLDGCRVYPLQGIMDAEDLVASVGIGEVPPLDDMDALLRHLRKRAAPCIVEQEPLEGGGDEARFLMGYVTRVGKKPCRVHHLDPLEGWEDEPQSVRVHDVTCVQLESPYVARWLRHGGPCPPLAPGSGAR